MTLTEARTARLAAASITDTDAYYRELRRIRWAREKASMAERSELRERRNATNAAYRRERAAVDPAYQALRNGQSRP